MHSLTSCLLLFLSTPSARRATFYQRGTWHPSDISIHALREEGDIGSSCVRCRYTSNFYPRPPRGGRPIPDRHYTYPPEFLSTPSARRATIDSFCERATCIISIHALREEGDIHVYQVPRVGFAYFYPRPPRGGRQQKRRKTSPLLFHYKTICTDLEELVQKHPKKQLRSAQNGLKTWCEGDGKGVSAFHSHRGEQARRSARLRIQTGDAPRCARPWSYSCCPVDKTADCPDRGR